MSKPYRTSLFLFRRDLRLDDNTGFLHAADLSERILPMFVFDPRQQPADNPYFTHHGFQFLIESLEDLEDQLGSHDGKLHRFHGLPHEIVDGLLAAGDPEIDAVFVNRDYTPFSRLRDGQLERVCAERGVYFEACSDLLLTEPGTVMTGQGDPYQTFTPFHRKALKLGVDEPVTFRGGVDFYRGRPDEARPKTLYRELRRDANRHLHVRGGRANGLEILDDLSRFDDYTDERDIPGVDGTTSLSAHHKFGTLSIREVAHAMERELGPDAPPLVRQLYWRDFFTQVAWFHPHVFEGSFKRAYDAVEWPGTDEHFEAWAAGCTGFPLVDAGMRQLAQTGFMHNRVRMVTASFLVKDLHVDWRRGEKHFANLLVDYDPCVNNGNWQWAASSGADPQPYFRIFNPWRQQERFDPEGDYIHRWVPELEGVDAPDLHRLHETPERVADLDYPAPIVDHKKESRRAQERYETALK